MTEETKTAPKRWIVETYDNEILIEADSFELSDGDVDRVSFFDAEGNTLLVLSSYRKILREGFSFVTKDIEDEQEASFNRYRRQK